MERLCSKAMADQTKVEVWNNTHSGHQVLALEHKLAAQRGAFGNVFHAMDAIDSDAARPQWHGRNDDPAMTRVLFREIPALAACVDAAGKVDKFAAMEVLNAFDRLSVLPMSDSNNSWVLKKYHDAIQAFASVCNSPTTTVRDIISAVVAGQLCELDTVFEDVFRNGVVPQTGGKEKESRQDTQRRGCR